MKTKLYFGILALLLAFLGTFSEQVTMPNQQIVIQFSDQANTLQGTEKAIEAIQQQLQNIGATHIQIGQNENGQLRITYHSYVDVAHIQKVLFKDDDFIVAYNASQNHSNNFPQKNRTKDFEVNISEINSTSDINWDIEGVQLTEINQKIDHFYTSKVKYSGKQILTKQSKSIIKVALSVNTAVVIAIDHFSYKLPEVRAGPIS